MRIGAGGETTPRRNYDKGERRYKHVANSDEATIQFDKGQPKKWVGKCPKTLKAPNREMLLNEAIAAPNGDRELGVPKRLYVVHEGAIYEAQTSDQGRTYHGYPYRGKLSAGVLKQLEEMALNKGCVAEFQQWVKKHIEKHGS